MAELQRYFKPGGNRLKTIMETLYKCEHFIADNIYSECDESVLENKNQISKIIFYWTFVSTIDFSPTCN